MLKIIGIDDTIHSCDCCGKSNLKHTILVEINGECQNYGTTCATRHTGLSDKEIKFQIKSKLNGIVAAAKKEYNNSAAHISLEVAISKAHKSGLVGIAFRNQINDQVIEDNKVCADIAAKYGIEQHLL